ncbi:ABC-2 type transport system ATP-binding protein [Atopostipes suicloacalis DSM 15692]|uniref:ABC-2 type transport system ATP-binding protein n=1 Tax=Atopostipes suicloacalis DSM 15692 TaxID=1121025 RepID=A0A1M4ZGU3_9LACT|nr:ABC transporter ATP-binding protein [Atopostipes suicloacalis]SHF17264.1 ABC-2 type transport system ATP-binding protein [Atopostipes suicloacalis DSM 15692]
MLEVKDLKKSFGSLTAVDGVNFTIEKGQIMGLIGQNGSGKTTTFRMILKLLNADEGSVSWNDQPFSKEFFDHVGYLPEERGLNQKMTIEHQILYFARLRGKKNSEIEPLIDGWLKEFEVVGERKDKIKSLSKGNQQKVQLICTLIHEPDLIILDEPFSGLDPVNAGLLEEGIRKARDRGASIIFSSHNMNNVEELCDNLVMLKKGRQVLYGTIREIRESFGRTRLFLESSLSKEEIENIDGVESVSGVEEGIYHIQLRDAEVGRQIFDLATRDGYIPTFSQQPPTIEEIFKQIAGEIDE